MTPTIAPRLFVCCLATYGSERYHGAWIDASSDPEEMLERIHDVLKRSPAAFDNVQPTAADRQRHPHGGNAAAVARLRARRASERGEQTHTTEEWAFHDAEGLPGVGEHESLDDIAEMVALIEEHGELAIKLLELHPDRGYVADLLESPYCVASSMEEWAEECFRQEIDARLSKMSSTWDARAQARAREEFIEFMMEHFDPERFIRDHDCSGGTSVEVGGSVYIFDR